MPTYINKVFDDVGLPGLIGDDSNYAVSRLTVIPNEILSHLIHLILVFDLIMMGTINRVSETFRECETVGMNKRWPRLHMSKYAAEALRFM